MDKCVQSGAPLCARDVMIAADAVIKVNWEDKIFPILKLMSDRDITHVLIVNERQEVEGSFSESTLLQIVVGEDGIPDFKYSQFSKYADRMSFKQVGLPRFFVFGKGDMPIDEIKKSFEQNEEQPDRLDMLIITDNGTYTGRLQGIITPWDIVNY